MKKKKEGVLVGLKPHNPLGERGSDPVVGTYQQIKNN
jgi:hypothetical protein